MPGRCTISTIHGGCKDYFCENCDRKFGLKHQLLRHQKTVHEGLKDFACDKCDKKFGIKHQLLRHQKTIHEGRKDFACDKCEKKFGYKWIMIQHKRTVHEGRKDYACDKCGKKFGRKLTLITHQKIAHEGRKDYACDNCEKRFGRKLLLLLHQKIVHEGQKDYACDKCEQKFTQKSNMLIHQRTVHEGRKDYTCDNCEKKFGHKSGLLLHTRTVHEGRKDYLCDKCKQKFRHKSSLLYHQKTAHEGRKDYSCDKCEQKFGLKSSLLKHQKTVHEGRKDYSCDKCEQKFGHKSSLLYHQKTVHEGRQDFACHKCEKKFGHQSHLIEHKKTVHEARKDYACDKCEKKFGKKSNLLDHQKMMHDGRKDYACSQCEKKFGRKGNLFVHQKIVHDDRKNFACNKCEKKFGKKYNLIRHQGTAHEGHQEERAERYQENVETLKKMREKVNWLSAEDRRRFVGSLSFAISYWKGLIPNIRDIFKPEEIECLLSDAVNYKNGDGYNDRGNLLIHFVTRSGYKNEPDFDKNGEPLVRRTTAVHQAAKLRSTDWIFAVSELFKVYSSCEANYTDESGLTHFHVACMSGVNYIVEKFLELGQDPNCIVRETGDSPLHLALDSDVNVKEVIELLLKNGADPNLANEEGSTPLHISCKKKPSFDYRLTEFFSRSTNKSISWCGSTRRTSWDYFAKRFVSRTQMRRACGGLSIVERLEKSGYELDRDAALTIMKIFAEYGLFKKSMDPNNFWYEDEKFASESEKLMIRRDLSLYDFIRLRPEEAAKLVTYSDIFNLSRYIAFRELPEGPREACAVHLCEITSKRFFRRWALHPFMELTGHQLPILCCEIIMKKLMNEDLWRICLTAADQNCHDQLPNLRDVFRPEEIDWLIAEEVPRKVENDGYNARSYKFPLIEFVIRTGYKDKPDDVDENDKPSSLCTTPAHLAARRGFISVADKLLKIYNRFDVNYSDASSGLTHFHVACAAGRYDIVKQFLELGQSVNGVEERERGDSPLYLALNHYYREERWSNCCWRAGPIRIWQT
ncbi:unnamed protein product [Trichogramma brassicae]|uniref:C2H2-type domain-containing protein n=1 Tax=Trichogramma brassicae TaxID=86971 RepID=A0A6H5I116_9HYME|nr:unnamed protein product [Trichogramma brassicae]